ncbi:hypothetical protein NQL31_003342 [Lotmaria passim]
MFIFGVEYSPFSCDRYTAIDGIITLVVVAVCLPVFITIYASRIYTGILLGLAVVFFFKLWRFLPSYQRWMERKAQRKAERLVAEWRMARPSTQVLHTPTAMTGIVEMSSMNAAPMTSMPVTQAPIATTMNSGGVGMPPCCSPVPGTPMCGSLSPSLPPLPFFSPCTVPVPPSPLPPALYTHCVTGSSDWNRQLQQQQHQHQQQPSQPAWSPMLLSPPPIPNEPVAESQRSFTPQLSPPSTPGRPLPPHLLLSPPPQPSQSLHLSEFKGLIYGEDAQGRCIPVEDSVWCGSRSASAASIAPSRQQQQQQPYLRPTSDRARRSADGSMVLHAPFSQVPPYPLSEHSMPASYRPATTDGSRYPRSNSPFSSVQRSASQRRQHGRPRSHHHHHRHGLQRSQPSQQLHGTRRYSRSRTRSRTRSRSDASQRSTVSSLSVESNRSSGSRSPVSEDRHYAVASQSLSAFTFPQYYG